MVRKIHAIIKEKSEDLGFMNENVIGFVKMQTSSLKNVSLLDYEGI